MKRIFRRVQFLANIATVVIALLLSFIVVKQYIFSGSESSNSSPQQHAVNSSQQSALRPNADVTPLGKTVPLENINWKENKKTLVLYLSTSCRYCTESKPFYQRLVKESSAKGIKLVAVLPQPVEEAKDYLKQNEINITDVRNSSLNSIGVRATPNLLLVDDNGVVSNHWRGKLSAEKENEVMAKLSV